MSYNLRNPNKKLEGKTFSYSASLKDSVIQNLIK